jgi:hypothetical protein
MWLWDAGQTPLLWRTALLVGCPVGWNTKQRLMSRNAFRLLIDMFALRLEMPVLAPTASLKIDTLYLPQKDQKA